MKCNQLAQRLAPHLFFFRAMHIMYTLLFTVGFESWVSSPFFLTCQEPTTNGNSQSNSFFSCNLTKSIRYYHSPKYSLEHIICHIHTNESYFYLCCQIWRAECMPSLLSLIYASHGTFTELLVNLLVKSLTSMSHLRGEGAINKKIGNNSSHHQSVQKPYFFLSNKINE